MRWLDAAGIGALLSLSSRQVRERLALRLSVAGFDAAREMLNVQDNKIDKLRSALQIARATIYSLDAREIYADELALIDAALKDKP